MKIHYYTNHSSTGPLSRWIPIVAEPDCGEAIGVAGSPRIIDSIKSDKTLLSIRRLVKP